MFASEAQEDRAAPGENQAPNGPFQGNRRDPEMRDPDSLERERS